MRSLSAVLFIAFHVALWSECATSDKELIMLEIEPIARDDRIKRSSDDAGQRYVRQAHAIPPEYLNLLQQLAPQQRAAAQQQQPAIEQFLVARDGNKQPAAARYVLHPDGRIVQERLTQEAIQQNQYHQASYVQVPQPPQPTGQPPVSPELEAFSRLQTQTQQDYHDAPIRAQIAGLTERPDLLAGSPPPFGGPGSPAPQVYPQAASQALAREQSRLRDQYQNNAYAQLQIDPNAFYQQFAQQQQAPQPSVASAETGRQLTPLYDLSQRQRVVYQTAQAQLQPQSQPQAQTPYTPKLPASSSRRPIGASAHAQLAPSTQPQLIQNAESPQQYLLETSRPSAQRYVAQEQPQPQPQAQDDIYASLFSNSGRGLFSPAASPKSQPSLYRPSPQPAPQDQIQTLRIPTPPNQRALTRAELDALVNAGYSITPVGNEEPESTPYLKAKRAPLPLTRRNHVIYQNQQDGVSYQYSPGSSDYNPSKSKRYAPKFDAKNIYRADNGQQGVLTYVVAVQNQAA